MSDIYLVESFVCEVVFFSWDNVNWLWRSTSMRRMHMLRHQDGFFRRTAKSCRSPRRRRQHRGPASPRSWSPCARRALHVRPSGKPASSRAHLGWKPDLAGRQAARAPPRQAPIWRSQVLRSARTCPHTQRQRCRLHGPPLESAVWMELTLLIMLSFHSEGNHGFKKRSPSAARWSSWHFSWILDLLDEVLKLM